MPQSPAMPQWQQRFDAASAAVRAAEQSKDPQRVRAAYEQLRQVQSVRPIGPSPVLKRPGAKPSQQTRPPANPASGGVPGVFNYIRDALSGANSRAR